MTHNLQRITQVLPIVHSMASSTRSSRFLPVLPVLAVVLLALPVASAAAKPGSHEHDATRHETGHGQGGAQGSTRLLAAADRFDRIAARLTLQATTLHGAATDARRDAADLNAGTGDGATTDQPLVDVGTLGTPAGDDSSTPDGTEPTPNPTPDCDPCDPATSTDDAEQELLDKADALDAQAVRLEQRAARATAQAARLREQAAKVLAGADDADAPKAAGLLKRARGLRAQAHAARIAAAKLRPTQFDGTEVDEDVVSKVEELDTHAATLDTQADRLEAGALTKAAAAD